MAFDVGVRDYLQGKGIANSDIGYDQNSGNVTVKGQNFYKPELNMAGTTYSNQQNLDNAYGNYTKQQSPQNTGVVNTTGVTTGAGQGGSGGNTGKTTAGYTNPYTQMIGDLIKHLSDSSNAPQQDVYSSPQYAAAKANQERQSADAIRHASESAAGAGLGHSTIMTDRTQRIQGDSDQQLATQLVPQIQAQLQQQRQQELQNQRAILSDYMNLGQQADSQHNADRSFEAGRQDAATAATGYYNPSGMTADQINQEIAKNSADYANASPEQQQQLHERNGYLNSLLGKTDSTGSGDYVGGNPNGQVGFKTLASKQLDNQVSEVAYNHARDSLLDKRYEEKFNQDIKQQGFENALKIAVQQHQISNDNAQLAISKQNSDTSAANAARGSANDQQDALYKIWNATGTAPAGIKGVAEGTPLYDKTGVRQDEAFKNKQGQLDIKAFSTERDGMIGQIRAGKVALPDAMKQVNEDEQLGIYTADLAEKLRTALRVLSKGQAIPGDTLKGPQIDLSGFGGGGNGGGTSVTESVFGG